MKPLTANRGLAFAVRWPNLDLKVSIKSVTVKLGKGHSNAYLFEDYKTTTQRTAESFRQDAELASETGEKVNISKLLLR